MIDGALHAAEALGADRVVLAVHDDSPARVTLAAALAERPQTGCESRWSQVPDRYIASEATALVRYLNSGDARPAGRLVPIWETGVGGRPTLVDNAETLAQLALIARFGPAWFGAVGTPAEPGTSLVTIGGAVQRPGRGGGRARHAAGLRARPGRRAVRRVGAARRARRTVGRSVGDRRHRFQHRRTGARPAAPAGSGRSSCCRRVAACSVETARILRYHADAGARQCGPCMFGLPAIAADMTALGAGDRGALDRLRRRLPVINGRGRHAVTPTVRSRSRPARSPCSPPARAGTCTST